MKALGLLAAASVLAACSEQPRTTAGNGTALPPVRDRNASTFSEAPAPAPHERESSGALPSRDAQAGDPPGGPAPEPGTILLFGSGLVALALTRRRKLSARSPHESLKACGTGRLRACVSAAVWKGR